ncbi:diguanylate cyclase [Yoonia sp.]|uniref:diguanylate cyclase n=1 Tax=Yoonia sp. TaxID=2212373 RepID=UPI001A0E679D|nr:diguanylate cyclase [Yoonia sp.]MBE0412482.1 diguanylate cyclase [Yoonia sp.]
MSGRILIIDTVATNRIVLKVKMLAAQFEVDACANQTEAATVMAMHRPDLILINLSEQVEDRHAFCRQIKANPDTAQIAIIAVGVIDTSRARLAALDAGADDVMPRPMNETLLMARIRSLLRVHSANQELLLRDGTSRALGFKEAAKPFETMPHVALLSVSGVIGTNLAQRLGHGLQAKMRQFAPCCVMKQATDTPVPDLFVIDASTVTSGQDGLFGLVSDLRSRAESRQSTQLVIVPPDRPNLAAMFLDLGADDVVTLQVSDAEITLRARALLWRKSLHDRLRDVVRNGLHAAITDPLTGLYNRRYVEPHLLRLAEQSRQSGADFAIMMLDIDHFKQINDSHGHASGDRVLVQLADRLRDNLRDIDLLARIGGEEFLVAMPRTTVGQAHRAANRLRRLVNCRPFDLGGPRPSLHVTVSVGVAISSPCQPEPKHLTMICNQADAALYAAKSAGRNQVAIGRSAA